VADGGVKVIDQASGEDFMIWNGDCVDVARGLPDGSLHYTVFSPPFESLYTFSDDPRDMSNCTDSATFWAHFKFLIAELYRATMPGRLCSIHCMQLPTSSCATVSSVCAISEARSSEGSRPPGGSTIPKSASAKTQLRRCSGPSRSACCTSKSAKTAP
jgi:hypothetical protein